MKQALSIITIVFVLTLGLYDTAKAIPVYTQAPDVLAGALMSEGPDTFHIQSIADDFTLAQENSISSVSWFGYYESGYIPAINTVFMLRLFTTTYGQHALPANLIFSQNIEVTDVYAGLTDHTSGELIYKYTMPLFSQPVLESNTKYWISITENDIDTDETWYWLTHNPYSSGGYSGYVQAGGDTLKLDKNMSFSLHRPSGHAPEPATVLLLCFGLIGLAFYQRKG